MTWIKICGTTNLEDAQTAVDSGADALGFVFYEKSPRNIDPDKAGEIVAALPQNIEKVGVFVTHSSEEIAKLANRIGLTAAQLHRGDHSRATENDMASLKGRGLKLIAVVPAEIPDQSTGIFLGQETTKNVFALMFDSSSAVSPGGTGKIFNWQQAEGMIQAVSMRIPVIVAGGLNSQNVTEAIKVFQPFGVDVVSGVESSPGKKDPEKVRAFIQAVRAADRTA